MQEPVVETKDSRLQVFTPQRRENATAVSKRHSMFHANGEKGFLVSSGDLVI